LRVCCTHNLIGGLCKQLPDNFSGIYAHLGIFERDADRP
jgi:hypothetical protein